jgi:hypothetical protein
MKINSS